MGARHFDRAVSPVAYHRFVTSDLYRWQAAMGAIVGALIADALASEREDWTAAGMRSLDTAEAHLAGSPLPVDLEARHAVPVAVGLALGERPLMFDPATVSLIDAIRTGLDDTVQHTQTEPLLAKAANLAFTNHFVDAVAGAGGDAELASLVGAFSGLQGGLGAIPARLVSTFQSPDGGRGRRYLCGLTNRLLGVNKPNWYDPRRRRGPKEVLPGVWFSNLYGLSRFTTEHPDGLVLSLCNEEGRIDGHPHHVTFHLEDTPRTDANPSLSIVLDEILSEVAVARADGQPVLLHCRHGASRTGLILRLLLVDELGVSPDDVLVEAQCLWPHTSSWNQDWAKEVERRSPGSVQL